MMLGIEYCVRDVLQVNIRYQSIPQTSLLWVYLNIIEALNKIYANYATHLAYWVIGLCMVGQLHSLSIFTHFFYI